MLDSVLAAFTAATISQRLGLVALVLAVGILVRQIFSRRQPDSSPSQAAALHERLRMMTARAETAEREQRALSLILNAIPGPIWRLEADGQLGWANTCYHSLSRDDLAVLDASRSGDIIALPGPPARAFEIDGGTVAAGAVGPQHLVHFGLPADQLVDSRASLRRFVDTLTQTFAHLPLGLAIFNHERQLGLFNPALSDLLGLDPSWLAGQPSFRGVMERLRASGRMPDRADFQSWLKHLQSMEKDAAQHGYGDVWQLPGGQNLRVTGRPHPDGALAFIFEDITHLSHVESRHRIEIALNQAILDRMAEAVAVFDTTGALVFANQSFDTLWQIDSATTLIAPDIAMLVRRWSALGGAADDWAQLRAHVTSGGDRRSGQTLLDVPDQGAMLCVWATLPDGSALVYFKTPPIPARWPQLLAPLARALAPGQLLAADRPKDAQSNAIFTIRQAIEQLTHDAAQQGMTSPALVVSKGQKAS